MSMQQKREKTYQVVRTAHTKTFSKCLMQKMYRLDKSEELQEAELAAVQAEFQKVSKCAYIYLTRLNSTSQKEKLSSNAAQAAWRTEEQRQIFPTMLAHGDCCGSPAVGHTWTLSWQCLHDMMSAFNCSVTVTEAVSRWEDGALVQ